VVRRLLVAVFIVLHGLVHLWYVVLSRGWVEVEEEMGWNGYSWLLSSVLPEGTVLAGASVAYVVVTLGFVLGGLGYAVSTDWWEPIVLGTAVLSAITIVAMWDGQFELLVEKGAVGVLIDVGLVVYVIAFE